jgi:bla regulator protein blaR1
MRPAAIAILSTTLFAQAPRFETVIIKSSAQDDARSGFFTVPGKVSLANQTVKDCVRIAYDLEVMRAPSAPKWLETDHFDIEATTPITDDRLIKAMLRALLQSEFGLTLHRETKTVSAFALVVSKTGPKIREVKPAAGNINSRRGSMTAESASIANLAQSLSVALNAPVIDMTALPGVFDFTLTWRPQTVAPGELTNDDDNEDHNVLPDLAPGPTLFRALEEQLGLKLDRRKIPMELMIIDSARRPKQ